MKDNVNYTGICHIDVYNNGILDKSIDINNKLTLGGQYCILNAISNSAYSMLNKVIFGSGSAAKAVTNTIGTVVDRYTKGISRVPPTIYTSTTQSLVCNWILDIQDYNGYTISEMGLLFIMPTAVEELFCRVTISTSNLIYKTSNIVLRGYWTITVTES